jgi:AcrR family transcriptional regulator
MRGPTNVPRKRAQQPRARVTVGAILDAAAHILSKTGVRWTTNDIARVAGVSIGSLYQYFPRKEAIAFALVRRTMGARTERVRQIFASMESKPLEEIVRAAIDALVEMRQETRLEEELFYAAFRFGDTETFRAIDRESISVVADLLGRAACKTRPLNAEAAAFVLLHGVRAILTGAAVQDPAFLRSPALREELTILVTSYLTGRACSAHLGR